MSRKRKRNPAMESDVPVTAGDNRSPAQTPIVPLEDLEQLRLRWAEVERQKSVFAMMRESYEFFRSQVIVRNGLHPGVSINLKTGEVANG